jgi:hypothetical protein
VFAITKQPSRRVTKTRILKIPFIVERETEGLYEVEHKTSASQKSVSVVSEKGIGHFTCDTLSGKNIRTENCS